MKEVINKATTIIGAAILFMAVVSAICIIVMQISEFIQIIH